MRYSAEDEIIQYLLGFMTANLLEIINRRLEDDLTRLRLVGDIEPNTKRALNKALLTKGSGFIKYVVSVATHPIGLHASISPYNSSREHMLAYIMDMFSISETKLKKMFLISDKSIKIPNVENVKSPTAMKEMPIVSKKRHSWRPELRLRVYPPTFFYKERLYLNNLFVRVYLFKNELLMTSIVNEKTIEPEHSTSGRKVLDYIFRGLRLSSSVLIRPVNEMRHLIKFKSNETSGDAEGTSFSKANYKMVQVVNDKTELYDDIHLNIRRYYCEPQTVHILRFEFWLNSDIKQGGFFSWYKRFARRLVYNRSWFTCFQSNQKRKQTYMNESQEFYGYINIKLTQLPSYPTKQNYSILSIQERKINSCEISLDLRNRRILEEDSHPEVQQTQKNDQHRKSMRDFLINHVRLYVNCLIYQSLPFSSKNVAGLNQVESCRNLILDNLFYLPAFTLINQHRLQSNLDQFEDRCLRRVAILILLINLENMHDIRANPIKILLLSVIKNEYMVMRRPVDDKTMQEVDPFEDSFEIKGSRAIIVELELATLRDFVNKFLNTRIEQWLIEPSDLDRSITRSSLKLFKTAISYIKHWIKVDKVLTKLLDDVVSLKKLVDQLLCRVIIEQLCSKLDEAIELERGSKNRRRLSNLWLKLLHDVNHINRDLSLYWEQGGLNVLIKGQKEFVSKLELFKALQRRGFIQVMDRKVDNYVN